MLHKLKWTYIGKVHAVVTYCSHDGTEEAVWTAWYLLHTRPGVWPLKTRKYVKVGDACVNTSRYSPGSRHARKVVEAWLVTGVIDNGAGDDSDGGAGPSMFTPARNQTGPGGDGKSNVVKLPR